MGKNPKIDFIIRRCFWVVPIVRLYGFYVEKVARIDESKYEMKVTPHILFLGKNLIKSWLYWISIKWVKRGKP